MNKTILRKKQFSTNSKNYIETAQNPVRVVTKSIVNDVLKGGVNDFWQQVVTAGNSQKNVESNSYHETSGDLSEGEELILRNFQKKEQKSKSIEIEAGETAVEYKRQILHGESRTAHKITREIETKIQEILIEIKRLMQTSRELQVEFKEVAVEQRVVNPGKYHETFFEWVLTVIKNARMKVEDSGAWLAAFKSKKNKRQYWTMFKKHGTTFGLSNERVVATQTG